MSEDVFPKGTYTVDEFVEIAKKLGLIKYE